MKKMIKILLSSIFCLSTLVGCSSSPYAKAEAQTLTIQGVPVYVEPDENTTQKDVDLYLKAVEAQPGYLINKCSGIHLQGPTVFRESCSNKDAPQNIGGFARYAENAAYIQIQTQMGGKIPDKDLSSTVSHELWHLYDYNFGMLSSNDFSVLYNQNPNSISSYARTNSCEFFAVSGAWYINSPEDLKQNNMDVYNYFEALPKE